MGKEAIDSLVAIFAGITGVAILAIIVSTKSNTTGVLQAFGSMFSNALGVAVSPVTGSSVQPNLSYPSSPMGGFGSLPNFAGFGQ